MVEITFWNGHLGSCKTLGIVARAYLAYYSGEILLANFELKPPLKFFYVRVSELFDMLHQLNPERQYRLLLDEAHQDADSYNWMDEKSQEFAKFVSQARKRNVSIDYVSQWMTGMIPRVRRLTDYIIKCKAIRNPYDSNPKTNLVAAVYKKYDMTEDLATPTAKWIMPASVAKFFYPMYDTLELIDEDVEEITA